MDWNLVENGSMPPLIFAAAGRHSTAYCLLHCSALDEIVRTVIRKDPWHDLFSAQERRKEVVKNMRNSLTLKNCLNQCISYSAVQGTVPMGYTVSAGGLIALCYSVESELLDGVKKVG